MRKLGPSQRGLLKLISERYSLKGGIRTPAGLTKDAMLSSDWRVVDRLHHFGLVEQRFVMGDGPTYFATKAGREALNQQNRKET